MAEIFRARELTASGREVALKIIRTDLTDDPTVSRRFLREVRALCRLCHPHILSPIAWGEAEGICYLVLPWVRDSTLSHLLNARGGVLTLEETLPLFGQLCQAVHNTHEAGIIHRDLKPHNVLVQQGTHVLLADFGVALDSTASRLTLTGGKPGSAEYDPGRTSRCENDLTQTWYKLPAPRRPRTAIPRRVCAGSRIPPKSTRGKTDWQDRQADPARLAGLSGKWQSRNRPNCHVARAGARAPFGRDGGPDPTRAPLMQA